MASSPWPASAPALPPLAVAARLAPVPLPPPREVPSPGARVPPRGSRVGGGILPKSASRSSPPLAKSNRKRSTVWAWAWACVEASAGAARTGEEPVVEVPGDLDAVAGRPLPNAPSRRRGSESTGPGVLREDEQLLLRLDPETERAERDGRVEWNTGDCARRERRRASRQPC
ncbi:unnamed protein product [Miscanthus lutarioriparius]|uniref:Uncharacterized protein n=1 Tax=Miscanthus lutarioriparius TaxID=422564 RepID=A0A811RGY8_9POAL|nr:unnamed protein product [Miscanthus lutarioriparius]